MILGISGGKRGGNTEFAVKAALEECKKAGLETDFINLNNLDINHCIDCGKCRAMDVNCWQEDDMPEVIEKLEAANGIIIGSPVYFGNISSRLATLFERSLPLRRHDFRLKNKIGGAIAAGGSRNGGQELVISNIHSWMFIHDMIVVGDAKPTSHFGGMVTGRDPEEVATDETGLETVRNLGKKMAETVLLTGITRE